MKVSLLLFAATACFLFSGCASRAFTIPSRAYVYENQDSSIIEPHSVRLDSLRVLFINQANDSTITQLDSLYRTLQVPKKTGVTLYHPHNGGAVGMHTTTMEGILKNQFLDISSMKVIQKLQETTDVFAILNAETPISCNQLDSISRKLNIDVILIMDRVAYDAKSETVESNYLSSNFVFSFAQLSQPSSSTDYSRNVYIQYKSVWKLLWLDKSTKNISRMQEIVQTGQYRDNAQWEIMEGIFGCALKVADDFTNLFMLKKR